jgi:NADH:ubiquinone reductase (H+-translocating)
MNVVILGGGYAAVWCHRALRRWMGPSVRITVVAPFDDHVFHGFTAEVLDGDLAPGLQTSPLAECLPGADRVRGWARRVDPERRLVEVEWLGERRTIGYDQLVVATGAHDRTDPVPGMAEHGWTLRFPGQVEQLRAHVDGEAATAAWSPAEAERRRTVVVVGAGFAGTEAAAGLGRRYGDARRVILVSSSRTAVAGWQDRPALQSRLRRNLDDAGVELLTGARVAAVDTGGVLLDDGRRIDSATVVATMGNHVPVLPGLERFQQADGQLVVDDRLRVADGIWSAGDVAAMRTVAGAAPKEALWAIRAGTTVGRNIARTARGEDPRRFRFRGLGTVASFAPGRSVATLAGIALPGLLGWLIRGVLFLWFMPSRRNALRIVRALLSTRTPVVVRRVRVEEPRRVLVPVRR